MPAPAPASGPANTARTCPRWPSGRGPTDGVNTLVVNAGSSTLKLRVVDQSDRIIRSVTIDPWKGDEDTDAIVAFARDAPDLSAAGHRVVHGGLRYAKAVLIDDHVESDLADLSDLAPLHQPRALAGIRAIRSVL